MSAHVINQPSLSLLPRKQFLLQLLSKLHRGGDPQPPKHLMRPTPESTSSSLTNSPPPAQFQQKSWTEKGELEESWEKMEGNSEADDEIKV